MAIVWLVSVVCALADFAGPPNRPGIRPDRGFLAEASFRPWWDTNRATTAAAVLTLATLAGIAWTLALRRRLSRQRHDLDLELTHRLALERQHRELTEGAPDAIFTLDAKGQILSANPAGTCLVGFSEAELKGMTIFDVLPAEERPRTAERLAFRFQSGGESTPFVVEVVDRAGRRRAVEVVSRVLQPPGGAPRLEGVARDITERRRTENALRGLVALTAEGGGERFFRSVTRHVTELLAIDHAYIGVLEPVANDHLRTLALYSLGSPAANTTFPLAGTAVETVLGREERHYLERAQELFPDDPVLPSLGAQSFLGLPLWSEAHRPLGVLVLLHHAAFEPTPTQLDVLRVFAARVGAEIDRIRATDALRLSEERFRQLAEQGEDVVWVFDIPERRLAYLAPSFTRLCGVPVEACRAHPRLALRLMDRRDRNRWLQGLAEAIDGPSGRYSTEFRIVRNGSSPRWILDQGVVIRDASGRPTRVSGVARDITARKEAELALAAERGRFRDLFENSPDAIFVESFDGILLDVNRAGCELHGLLRERLVGRHVLELVPEAHRDEARRDLQRLVAGETRTVTGYSLRSDGSAVPVELHATRIIHDNRNALLIHARDTSSRRAAEDFLAGQKRILEWIATAEPIGEILDELARVTEARASGTLCWTYWFLEEFQPEPQLAAPSFPADAATALGHLTRPGGPIARKLAASENQPLVIAQVGSLDPTDPRLASRALDRGLVAVPVLTTEGRLLGAFGALLPPTQQPSALDLDLLRLSGSLARVAIERHLADATLRDGTERLRRANSALLDLARSEAISRGDLGAALAEITEAAARSVGVSRVSVWLLDESAALLRRLHQFSAHTGGSSDPQEFRIEGLPLYIEAITRERLVSITDVVADPRVSEFMTSAPPLSSVTSRLDAGIRLRGRIAGVVVLEHEGSARHWKAEEELIAGSLADIVAMALQASERRCIEEALRQSEEAYRSVVSALAEGVLLVNRDGAFLAYNDSASEILGLGSAELTNRRLGDRGWTTFGINGNPLDPSEFPANITLRTGQPITDSVMGVQRPDGHLVWISINTRPFSRDDDGQVASVVVSFTDITRRQAAERALVEGHELLRAISEVQARFIADADPLRNVERMLGSLIQMTESEGGGIAEVAESATEPPRFRVYRAPARDRSASISGSPAPPEGFDELFEYVRVTSRAEVRSLSDPSGPSPEQRRHFLGLPLRHDNEVVGVVVLLRSGQPYNHEIAQRLEPLLITCANLVRAIHTDRQRQEAEARIRQLNAELEQRVEQRTADLRAINQELAEFAYVVTHDLKAPLRGIHQLSEWLAQDHAERLDSSGLRLLALLRQRVLHLQRLIDGLLACARVGRSPEPVTRVATRELVRQVISVLAPPLNVSFAVADDLPVVEGNPERLHQVFQNLLDNAVKYLDKPEGHISVSAHRENGAWLFTVRDNGPGIPKRYRDKVFLIFQRLHHSGDIPGTGLGLTLVKRIVESRGGRIWIESQPEEGTTVCFTWPDHAKERPVA